MEYILHDFPMGRLLLVASRKGLVMVRYLRGQGDLEARLRFLTEKYVRPNENEAAFKKTRRAFDRYFAGEAESFSELTADFALGTPYQGRVWRAAREIPHGRTAAYRDLARRLGHKGYRSIGQALNRNPLLIVVPCHRIISADGGIGGFGAGLDLKRWLLTLEGNRL